MSEACKKVIADFLIEASKKDRNIVVLCSDSRGSAALGPYAAERKEQFIEVGIAEQNQAALGSDGAEQLPGQGRGQHGGLVHNQQVVGQGIVLVVKRFAALEMQQPVDGLGIVDGHRLPEQTFADALGRLAGGGAEANQQFRRFGPQRFHQLGQGVGFTGAGAAVDNQKLTASGGGEGLLLPFVEPPGKRFGGHVRLRVNNAASTSGGRSGRALTEARLGAYRHDPFPVRRRSTP